MFWPPKQRVFFLLQVAHLLCWSKTILIKLGFAKSQTIYSSCANKKMIWTQKLSNSKMAIYLLKTSLFLWNPYSKNCFSVVHNFLHNIRNGIRTSMQFLVQGLQHWKKELVIICCNNHNCWNLTNIFTY